MSTVSLFPGLLTSYEAASFLGRSHSQVCRYVRLNLLPAKRVGNNILIDESALRKFNPPPRGNPNFRRDE